MTKNSERKELKEYDSTRSSSDSQGKPENPMKSVETKRLPTKMVYFSEHNKKNEDNHSSY